MKNNRVIAVALAVFLLSLSAGMTQAESKPKKYKVKGLITSRTGESLVVKAPDGGTVKVALNDDTKVQQPKGLGLRHKEMSAAVLIPGLRITVEGTGDPTTQLNADTITFDSQDLQLAETIQAGLTPTAAQVHSNQQNIASNQQSIAANQKNISTNQQNIAANQVQNAALITANQDAIVATSKRFSELSEYDDKGDLTVNFAVGKSDLSDKDKAALAQLAQSAIGLTGYIIQVKGYADSSGNATMNQQLSMDRAQAVIAYLLQDCKVPIRHIVAPGAMGTVDPAASNETSQGRAENRRVEIKVLVNRGVAGS
ncbi:MAG TPA: OmpA family protein [Terriglobales bacterium]